MFLCCSKAETEAAKGTCSEGQGAVEEAQFAIKALTKVPWFYARWKQACTVVSSGDHVFL